MPSLRTSWLYLENAQMPRIWRCVGFCLLMNGLVAATFASVARPYLVPSFWFMGPSIPLTQEAFNIYVFSWLGVSLCGVPMLLGSRHKVWPALALVVMTVLGLMEYTSVACSFIMITYCYLVALLFDRPGASASARLMQICIASVYITSAIHKLHGEWFNGATMMSILHGGWNVYPMWMPLLGALNFGVPATVALSLFTVAFEAALPVGLFFEKTRKLALIGGILFHVGLTVLLAGIIPFAPTMLTGYLAFFKNKRRAEVVEPRVELVPALAFIALMVLTPLRFAVLDKPAQNFSFMDWTPWSMAMFLYEEKIAQVDAAWQSADGLWHDEALKIGRMRNSSSDKDLRGLAHFVLLQHPDAVSVKVHCLLVINGHRWLEKVCTILGNGSRK